MCSGTTKRHSSSYLNVQGFVRQSCHAYAKFTSLQLKSELSTLSKLKFDLSMDAELSLPRPDIDAAAEAK